MKPLPYSGYSWNFNQHAIALNPKHLYGLLAAASLAEGQERPGPSINKLLAETGVLTENIRNGKSDAWRDYQQVLSELGLIYSVKIKKELTLTPAGQMLLAGDLGFSEVITAQALRYQYPNGFKSDVQAKLKSSLSESGTQFPEHLFSLQMEKGLLIKPAILILRVLLSLEDAASDGALGLDDCLEYLLPIQKNSDWQEALTEILASRRAIEKKKPVNPHARRNLQDWFKFLNRTCIFEVQNQRISIARGLDRASLKKICTDCEDPKSFWLPTKSNEASKLSWFDYFGVIPFNLEVLAGSLCLGSGQVYAPDPKEFIGGVENLEDEPGPAISTAIINLQSFSFSKKIGSAQDSEWRHDPASALRSLQQGIIRRKAKHSLHEEMVRDLATCFKNQGAKVFDDPNSVDLLVTWPTGLESVIEVKTVNARNISQRLRLAVGQIEEYSYRRSLEVKKLPEKIIAINAELPEASWQKAYLGKHMEIGLIAKVPQGYKNWPQEGSKSYQYWPK